MYKKKVPADVNARRSAAFRSGGGAHSMIKQNKAAVPDALTRTPVREAVAKRAIGHKRRKSAKSG